MLSPPHDLRSSFFSQFDFMGLGKLNNTALSFSNHESGAYMELFGEQRLISRGNVHACKCLYLLS